MRVMTATCQSSAQVARECVTQVRLDFSRFRTLRLMYSHTAVNLIVLALANWDTCIDEWRSDQTPGSMSIIIEGICRGVEDVAPWLRSYSVPPRVLSCTAKPWILQLTPTVAYGGIAGPSVPPASE